MVSKFNIGKKIKGRRLELGITQSSLASNKITRNMISLIENEKAIPSLETALYLCDALDIPISFLLSDNDDLFYLEKNSKISKIKNAFSKKNYSYCIELINSLSSSDDEINYILSQSTFMLGKEFTLRGQLISAIKYLELALEKSSETIYDTSEVTACAPLYLAIAKNIESPLLEFERDDYLKIQSQAYDVEIYKYTVMDYDYDYTDPLLITHVSAKKLLKVHKYQEAIKVLLNIDDFKNAEKYNAFVFFGAYSDLEYAYKQIGDFENAYRYSSKRLSMISGFKA